MITRKDIEAAEQAEMERQDSLSQVHPIFQPILDHYSCSRADQELVDAAAVCHVCERQKRAIREALYWLDVGCMERATESLKRALP